MSKLHKIVKDNLQVHDVNLDIATNRIVLEVVEAVKREQEIENPYPESVFGKITKEEYKVIHKLLVKHLGFPIDRLSGSLMRYGFNICQQKMTEALDEMKEVNMNSKILHSVWFTSPKCCTGIVVTENDIGQKKAYINMVSGQDEESDAKSIAEQGAPVTKESLQEVLNKLR